MRTEIPGCPRVQVHQTRTEAGVSAAQDIAYELRRLLNQGPSQTVRMFFAAAPSQEPMLEALAQETGIDWTRVTAFHLDEYLGLPGEAPQRFGNWLQNAFFGRVPLGQVQLIDPEQNPHSEAKRYADLLGEAPIDIGCIGIGDNGHLAFNDPPDADFVDPEPVRVVELDERSRIQQVEDGLFTSVDQVPTTALTLTIPTLLSAEQLFCIAPGSRKQSAVEAALTGPIGPACPASALRTHPACTLYLDKEATPDGWDQRRKDS